MRVHAEKTTFSDDVTLAVHYTEALTINASALQTSELESVKPSTTCLVSSESQ